MRTISMSKTKNKIVRRKNRREKGNRAVFRGSNPHSNGDDFSRSFCDFIDINLEAFRITEDTTKERNRAKFNKIIDIEMKSLFNFIKVIRSAGAISFSARSILTFSELYFG